MYINLKQTLQKNRLCEKYEVSNTKNLLPLMRVRKSENEWMQHESDEKYS